MRVYSGATRCSLFWALLAPLEAGGALILMQQHCFSVKKREYSGGPEVLLVYRTIKCYTN